MAIVAVDAMGGDHGPAVAMAAAAAALDADPELEIRLFGAGAALEAGLADLSPALGGRVSTFATGHFVAQDASPARALRNGAGTSMFEALASVARGDADAMVCAGNTGALMALARSGLGMLPGIERPALMSAFPTRTGHVWVLDLGANINVDAGRLHEFAVLGSAAVSCLLRRAPRVGLLNVGREQSKGPDVIREAARRLEAGNLNFVGYVEGHEVFDQRADLVVCDGFAGNILLKCAEGTVEMAIDVLQAECRGPVSRWFLKKSVARLKDRLNPANYNGASLLGINGIVVKSHGRAGPRAFARAIDLAALEVRGAMLPELERQLSASI